MASVELRPGDTLNIIWSGVQETPFGQQKIESNFTFSYDELLGRLKGKNRTGKSKSSGTDGARFSRLIALSVNALIKGRWSTGASIDRDHVFEKLLTKFNQLDPKEYKNITENAKTSLKKVHNQSKFLDKDQKSDLKKMIDLIENQDA